MTSDLRIQGEVVVNSEQAESAFNRVGDKAQQMANEVATSAGKAGQAVDKIGDGAGASAEKFTRAESRISASIKRATNELELLGKTASQRLEFNISDKGLDAAKFEPALKKLRELEAQAQAAQRAATGSLDKMGISAAQTAAALRGVPAQFTDIVTSLQGGQAPLTVFLQQGGQLKDMFGGAGAAARALGGYVVGLVNPFTVAAAAGVALALAYKQGSAEADAYNKALITTGNAAGTNAAQLKAYAQEISAVVGTQGKAAESLAALASTGKIGAEALKEAAQAAVQYERATGQAVDKTAEQFASLRNEPLAAVLKLNDGMNFLTDSTYKQIKSLEDQGKTAEAANVAQRAFADTLAGRAGEMERNLGTVERGWLAVKDAAKSAWDAILNVGRASTNVDQLAAVRKQIADRENQLANGGFGANGGGAAFGRPSQAATERLRAELSALQAQAAALEGVANQSRVAAEEERKRGEQVKATAAFDKAGEKFLTDKAKMERELAAARVQGAEAGKSQAEIEQRLAQIRESYAKKGASNTAAENKELRDQMRVFADLAGVSSTYYAELANYQKQRANNVITEQQYVQAVEALIKKQPFAVAIAKEQADATKAQAKASEEAAKAHLKYVESFAKGANAAQQQADQLRTEEAAAAIAASGYYSLAQAIELVTIARLEEKRDGLLGNEEAYLAVQKEIDARKELVGLIGAKEARKAAEDSAKDAAREWERAAADINRSLTDALLRGFESGKGFAKNFVDTMKNLFSTLVLRPIISAVVNPVAGAITGALGLAGTASAATSVAGAYTGLQGTTGILGNIGTFLGTNTVATNTAIATSLGIDAASASAAATGASAAGGGALGGLLSNPITMGLGAIAALSLLSKLGKGETRTGGQFGVAFDGSVTNQRRGQTYTIEGQQFDRDFTNGLQTALKDGIAYRLEGDPVAQESAIREAVAGTASGINGFLKALGSAATLTGFSAGLETSGKGRGGVFAGGLLSTGQGFGESGKGDNYAGTLYEKFSTNSPDFKAALENFTLDLKQSTIQALQTVTDIPKSVQKLLTGVDAEGLADDAANKLLETINAQIVGVNSLRDAFKAMGLDGLAALGFDAAAGLAEVSGGFDKLLGNLNTYYSNFFSADEQRANVQRQLQQAFAGLNLTLPDINADDARAQFRAIVEGAQQDLSESGQKTYATLLSLSGAFAGVTKELDGAATAVGSVGDAARNLKSDIAGLQIDLLRAKGDTTGANAAQRALDTTGLSAADVALYDYKQALIDQINTLNAASQAIADQTEIRKGFERQLLELSGDTAALRLLDIQGMDAANVALYDRVQALTASQAAEQAAADKAKQVAQERYGIETSMLQLQGNTAALRARELALLDPANRADQLRLYLLQDAQEAAKAAADAERDLAATRVQSAQDAYRAAQEATGSAFDALSRSVSAERSLYESARAAAADAAQEIKSVIDTLSGSIQDLYAGVDSTRQASAAEGSAFIARALQAARATGYLPDSKGLSDAITQARGGLGSQNYATQFEADRAQLVMAGQLSELSDIAKPQLTAAERTLRNAENQLKTLDDILKNAQSQVDAVRGISTTVGTIPAALYGLQAALLAEAEAKAQAQATTLPPETAPTTPTTPPVATTPTGGALSGPYASQITDAIKAAAYTADDRLVYDTARMFGVTSSELDKLMGWTAGTSLDWAKRNNLPAFAVGTNYVPRDMLATIHEGEAIVPKAFNPWAAGGQGMGGGNAEVVAELRALRQQNERLEARLASIEGSNNTMANLLDDVTDGGNAMRSEVMA